MNATDNFLLSVIVIVIFYAYTAGFVRLTKPAVSIIIARLLCPVISIFLQRGTISDILREKINALLTSDISAKAGISEYISGAVIAVVAFFITYIVLRITVEYLYALFQPRFSIARKLDKILAIILGVLTVVIFTYIIYNGCIYLRMVQIEWAGNIADSIDNSFITKRVIVVFEAVLGGITWR